MVGPIYIIAITLAVAFLLPLISKLGNKVTNTVFLLTLGFLTFISGEWLYAFVFKGIPAVQIFTAGVKPPLSINLQMGLHEALFATATNLLALVGGLYLIRCLKKGGIRAYILFLLLTLGLNGLIMTRDIFNLFVFMEITSIASYILVGIELKTPALSAGFRYMVAGSIASTFLLLGIIFLYSLSGTLNIDGMLQSTILRSNSPLVVIAVFMLLFSFFIEMKQFPANGWALDVYQASHPGIAAMISAGSSGAIFFALAKILPIAGQTWYLIAGVTGMVTFVVSNLMGIRQQQTTRMLGYSSVGQMGLLLSALGLGLYLDPGLHTFGYIIAALFFNHFFAKAGLYWLAGMVRKDNITDWSVLRNKPMYVFLMGLFIAALLGFPPFAGFWGKWWMVMMLAQSHMFVWIAFLLIGSLLEAVYLLRWFNNAVRGQRSEERLPIVPVEQKISLWIFGGLSLITGWLFSLWAMPHSMLLFIPVGTAVLLYALDWLPAKVKGGLVIVMMIGYAWLVLPGLSGISFYFNLLFLGGGVIMTFGTLHRRGKAAGFYPLLILLFGALSDLVLAQDLLQFFFAWELMTLASYLLILRGRDAEKPSLSYVLFSLGGAYLILAGFAVAYSVSGPSLDLSILHQTGIIAAIVFSLVGLGFLIKVAAIGVHIWAPGSYAESEDDVTPLISGILSKAGILGLIILLIHIGTPVLKTWSLDTVLGWIGALTAFFATLFAIFQEDAKKLLAYSSIGQVGYIVLGLAMMTHLGWAAALWHTVNHLMFKGLLFLAIAGVIYRTGTRNMYEMGGLIKKMPLSFFSVLIGIIALAGIPPLTGFGGKWLLYEALIEKGWYLQTGLAFFASTIAFLYCYRLIHSIFLGMPKPAHKDVKEAPVWLIIPQIILIIGIIVFSVFPGLLLKPISSIIDPVFPTTMHWTNLTVFSSLGYWNGTFMMILVVVIFVLVTLYLLWHGPRPQKVEPFNIVFAAERPFRPETTHYAYDFFAPYRRAIAPILKPLVQRFWDTISEWVQTTSGIIRLIYTGNMQTYAMYIFLYGVILYLFSAGVH